jgi:D-alanyl-D-alanine dipeptidase
MRNGQIPASQLRSIGGGYSLIPAAARSFNAMSAESLRRYSTRILVRAAYRTLAMQWYFWRLYQSGRGNLAAFPGTSNHGWGLAIDLFNQRMRQIVDAIGSKYGWAKRWSDAQSEWWHIKYSAAHDAHHYVSARPTLHHGMHGASVKLLKRWLRGLGFKSVDHSNVFGHATVSAVKRLQKKHHLKADGVVGPATWKLLSRLVHH